MQVNEKAENWRKKMEKWEARVDDEYTKKLGEKNFRNNGEGKLPYLKKRSPNSELRLKKINKIILGVST